ncbi:MAG TPA: hypothetical protein V6C81_31705 [Planktothrix sp.]
MCISNNNYPTPAVDFNDTILLGLEVKNPQGDVEHICGYYNKVKTTVTPSSSDFGLSLKPPAFPGDFGWDIAPAAAKKGNAMLIAIPAVPGTVNRDSLIPTAGFSSFMQDYKTALVPPAPKSRGISFGANFMGDSVEVVKGFDGGLYDVVIASSATLIKTVIEKVDEAKRPEINEKLYGQLAIAYPKWTFVLFCFEEADAEKAGCALVKYKPMRPDYLYLPGLDGHNGEIERGQVALDHTLVVGSYRAKSGVGKHVTFSDREIAFKQPYFLLDRVTGRIIPAGTKAPQGDFLFRLEDVQKGDFRCKRALPPNWNALGFGTPDGDPWIITEPERQPYMSE